ncbi:MAG TPA: hypothetical protein VM327_05515 [Candidatus Thermoplasmatota archaeon]|nr:hypothetical protein [Candidatus Thermoplasmatota archaeon]
MATRRWMYRVSGGLLVSVAAALLGSDIGLVWARGKDGWAALGAALWGFLGGAAVGLAGAIAFVCARPPSRALHRGVVMATLSAFVVLALVAQEALD